MAPTDSALVLVARTVSSRAPPSNARKSTWLDGEVLDDGLDYEVGGGGQVVRGRDRAASTEAFLDPTIHGGGIEVETGRASGQALADTLPATGDGGRVRVEEHDRVAGLECKLGDAGAHGPRTDDPDRVGAHLADQTGLMASNGWRHSMQ